MSSIIFHVGKSMVTGRAKVNYEVKGSSSLSGGTSTKVKDADRGYTREWAPWGASDNLPTELREKAQKGDTAPAAFRKWNELIYGEGLFYWRVGDGQDMAVTPAYVQEVEDFLEDSAIRELFLPAQISDFGMYWCCFSEILLNERRDKITYLHHKTAEFCRLKPVNDTEVVKSIVYSPKFPYVVQSELKEITLVDRFRWKKQLVQSKPKKKKYAIFSFYPTPGQVFYPTPYHIGLFKKDGWIDYTNNTPLILTKMRENQVKIMLKISVALEYFEEVYGGGFDEDENTETWENMSDIRKRELIGEYAQKIEDTLTGAENWGKSVQTVFRYSPDGEGKEMDFVKIDVIDHKFKSDEWIPGNENASGTIAQAIGIDPTTIGMQKSGVASGSGSDKRVAFNTSSMSNTIYQKIILWQLNFIARFNGWNVRFGFRHNYNVSTDFSKNGVSSTDQNHDDNGTV